MDAHPIPSRIGSMARRSRREIRVVDLSETSSWPDLTALHSTILDTLRRAVVGVMSEDELLESTRGHSFSDVKRALRDLTLQGLVKVLWRSPFRFMAFITERGRERDLPALALPTGMPS